MHPAYARALMSFGARMGNRIRAPKRLEAADIKWVSEARGVRFPLSSRRRLARACVLPRFFFRRRYGGDWVHFCWMIAGVADV